MNEDQTQDPTTMPQDEVVVEETTTAPTEEVAVEGEEAAA